MLVMIVEYYSSFSTVIFKTRISFYENYLYVEILWLMLTQSLIEQWIQFIARDSHDKIEHECFHVVFVYEKHANMYRYVEEYR
jgi:hypothetical protein